MKILVPVDFSDFSINAFQYAIGTARDLQAEIVLFHASHNIKVVDVNVMISIDDLLLKESNDKLNDLIKSQDTQDVSVSYISKIGLVNDLITEVSKKENIDFIVMGTKGASGLEEVFLGSVTSSLIRKSNVPILAIPGDAKYESLKNITIALDFKDTYANNLSLVKQLAVKKDGEIDILHIKNTNGNADIKDDSILSLEEKLDPIKHSYVFLEKSKTTSAILEYIKQNNPDLLIVISKAHSLFERLFHKSVSETLAMNISIPLLIMKG